MTRLYGTLGLLAAGMTLGATAVQAEGFKQNASCGGSTFSTCAAVHISAANGGLMVSHKTSFWRAPDDQGTTFALVPDGEDFRLHREPVNRIIIPEGCDEGSFRAGTCGTPTTVTPEPVSMTLLATGLVGLGVARRKRKQTLPV
jgi:hypothetical protein